MVCGCRTQLTTDQLKIYLPAVDLAFESRVDYGMLQKYYAGEGTQSEFAEIVKLMDEVNTPGEVESGCVARAPKRPKLPSDLSGVATLMHEPPQAKSARRVKPPRSNSRTGKNDQDSGR